MQAQSRPTSRGAIKLADLASNTEQHNAPEIKVVHGDLAIVQEERANMVRAASRPEPEIARLTCLPSIDKRSILTASKTTFEAILDGHRRVHHTEWKVALWVKALIVVVVFSALVLAVDIALGGFGRLVMWTAKVLLTVGGSFSG